MTPHQKIKISFFIPLIDIKEVFLTCEVISSGFYGATELNLKGAEKEANVGVKGLKKDMAPSWGQQWYFKS